MQHRRVVLSAIPYHLGAIPDHLGAQPGFVLQPEGNTRHSQAPRGRMGIVGSVQEIHLRQWTGHLAR